MCFKRLDEANPCVPKVLYAMCLLFQSPFFLEIQCHRPITVFHENIQLLVPKPWLTRNTALTNFPVKEKYYIFLGNSYLPHRLKGGLAAS